LIAGHPDLVDGVRGPAGGRNAPLEGGVGLADFLSSPALLDDGGLPAAGNRVP
jgi:hypothetical protein